MEQIRNPNLIGISGKIGSGKDTIGTMIQYFIYCKKFENNHISFEDFSKESVGRKALASDYVIKKFAGKLKKIVSLLTGIPAESFEDPEIKNRLLPDEWRLAGWQQKGFIQLAEDEGVSYRHLLQIVGTNALRDIVHPNVHINALFADFRMEPHTGITRDLVYTKWIITDVRFPNEADAIIERGGLLLRTDRLTPNPSNHPSECALDIYNKFHVRFPNNGSLHDLLGSVYVVLKDYNII